MLIYVTTPIYECLEIRSKYNGDHKRQISASFHHLPATTKKTKQTKKTTTTTNNKQQPRHRKWGSGVGGGGGGGAVTSPMNECTGVTVSKMSLPTHRSNQEYGNNLKTKKSYFMRSGDIRKSITERRKRKERNWIHSQSMWKHCSGSRLLN